MKTILILIGVLFFGKVTAQTAHKDSFFTVRQGNTVYFKKMSIDTVITTSQTLAAKGVSTYDANNFFVAKMSNPHLDSLKNQTVQVFSLTRGIEVYEEYTRQNTYGLYTEIIKKGTSNTFAELAKYGSAMLASFIVFTMIASILVLAILKRPPHSSIFVIIGTLIGSLLAVLTNLTYQRFGLRWDQKIFFVAPGLISGLIVAILFITMKHINVKKKKGWLLFEAA